MTNIEMLTEFFGWCSLINIGMLIFYSIVITVFLEMLLKIHMSLLKLDRKYLQEAYFKYLAQYKIVVIIFNIVPYIVLKIMS
ncbi:MAG: hypothetical protein GQ570_08350 [Helicobacteraceae bacterium]|nr:hypothetical protein [Helicobacteraceae bacterium]